MPLLFKTGLLVLLCLIPLFDYSNCESFDLYIVCKQYKVKSYVFTKWYLRNVYGTGFVNNDIVICYCCTVLLCWM